jgi:hypothetical protein
VLLTALAAAAGILVGQFVARKWIGRPKPETVSDPPPPPPRPPVGFAVRVGDVVMTTSDGEAWVSGALVFSDASAVSALFFGPDKGDAHALYTHVEPATELGWLAPLSDQDARALLTSAPVTLERGGRRFEQTCRLPLFTQVVGEGTPEIGPQIILREYASEGGHLIVALYDGPRILGFEGRWKHSHEYELVEPSGESAP